MHDSAPCGTLERVPMLRGRIVAANGIKAEDLKPAAGSGWVLRGDRGITYAAAVPAGSRLVAGEWWPADYSGPPLVSLENKTAHDLDLKLGDTITVNVLGRSMTARIANLRAVDWQSLGINFVLVFSPGAFTGAPHTDIATLTFADGGTAAGGNGADQGDGRCVPRQSPPCGSRKRSMRSTASWAISLLALRGASAMTLVAAALVLGGALAAGQRFRIYDAVILRDAGRYPAAPSFAYALEYLLIGAAAVRVRRRGGLARRGAGGDAGNGVSVCVGAGDRRSAPRLARCCSRSCSALPARLPHLGANPRKCSGICNFQRL